MKFGEFNAPPKSKIWRYLDFTKFVSLILNKKLFFCRVDNLGDPYEGSIVNRDISSFEYSDIQHADYCAPTNTWTVLRDISSLRKLVYVNCWCKSQHESEALWKLYIKGDQGVAIQSTAHRLKKCIKDPPPFTHGYDIAQIKYIDYDKDTIDYFGPLAHFFYKRKSFEHEREIRAIVWDPELNSLEKYEYANGLLIPVDLNILIEKIYIVPTAPEWFFELIVEFTKRYKIKKEVKKSKLSEMPIYKKEYSIRDEKKVKQLFSIFTSKLK